MACLWEQTGMPATPALRSSPSRSQRRSKRSSRRANAVQQRDEPDEARVGQFAQPSQVIPGCSAEPEHHGVEVEMALQNYGALLESELRELEAATAEHQGLDDIFAWGRRQNPAVHPADVIKQDEFTHDVLVPLPSG